MALAGSAAQVEVERASFGLDGDELTALMRSPLREALTDTEERVLAQFGLIRKALLRAGEAAVVENGLEAVGEVQMLMAESDRDRGDIHERLLGLIARQAPVAGDLRLAIALLHVNDRLARMASQCLNITTLCGEMKLGERLPRRQLECFSEMVRLAEAQIGEAMTVFVERDVDGVRRLRARDQRLNRANRRCFALAVAAGEKRIREAVFFIALMARAVERIGDNAVDVARQAEFVATGRLPSESA
jgi:phosphate transport system protein